MSDSIPSSASNRPTPSLWESEGHREMEREMSRTIEELHDQMLAAKSDLAALAQKGDEAGFQAALPSFLAMSFAWLNGDAISGLDRDDYHYGESLVDICAQYGRAEALKALLRAGADPKGSEPEDSPAIHHAARSADAGAPACALALIEAGVSVDEQNSRGDSPLGIAARCGNIETMALLLTQGANVELRNKAGESVADRARDSGHEDAWGALMAWREAKELGVSLAAGAPEAPARLRI